MISETWKLITSTSDRYEISSFGRIRSLFNTKGNLRDIPKLISPWQTGRKYKNGKRGSLSIKLTTNDGLKRFKVHHLVLEAFVGPKPSPNYECAHLNGDILNNRIDNLKWVTHKENENHKKDHGTLLVGEKHGASKLTNNQTNEIFKLREKGLSHRQIAEKFNVSRRHVGNILAKNRRQNRCGF